MVTVDSYNILMLVVSEGGLYLLVAIYMPGEIQLTRP
jgi:hypothetical protein